MTNSDLWGCRMNKTTVGNLCKPCLGQLKLGGDALIDYFDITSVDNIEKQITGYTTYIFSKAPSRARKQVKKGNILVSTVRPNLNAVALFDEETKNTPVVSTGFCVLECKVDTSPRFLFRYLQSKSFVRAMVSQATGASYPAVSDKIVRDAKIPAYSYEEQIQIANVLDATANVVSKRKQQLQKLDELVKARFVELFGDPKINPNKYPVCQLSEHIAFLTSGSRGWAQYCADDGTEWFITIRNVKDCHIETDNMQPINAPDNAEAKRTRVQEGDLLISITADLGRTGVVTKEIAEHGAYINQHLTCIRLKQDVLNPLYVAHFMESPAGKEQFESKNQNAVKAGLNFNSINSLYLMVPPLDEQNAFVDFIKQIDKSKAAVQKALGEAQLLFDSLMQKYFG